MKCHSDKEFPNFDQTVPANGYAWWYADAVSDDGNEAITLIAFVGSVFSPYYARARKQANADPVNHCALNVAVYSRQGKRWAMTERSRSAVSRSASTLQIGPSSMNWDGSSITFKLDELTVPLPSRIRGQVRIWPTAVTSHEFALDKNGLHRWRPMAPCGRVEVSMTHPRLNWSGDAYCDSNAGERPLEMDFDAWNWSRSSRPDGTIILYEGTHRGGGNFSLALIARPDGSLEPFIPPAALQLKKTRWWRIDRQTRSDSGKAKILGTLEDTPFYSRSLLQDKLMDKPVTTIHESLSMDRFRSPWVHCLLPFRMPRPRG